MKITFWNYKSFLLFVAVWLTGIFTTLAQTYYVKPNGSSTANGLSWANAVTIERALEIAPSNAEIWLMQGTYSITETLEVGVGDWSKNGLKLYGGFRGNETALNQRDWQNRKTILDGNNSVRIMRYRDEKNGLLDGITFQRGFVTGDNEGGGAIHFFIFATSTIRNCTFTANVSEGSRGAGAIYFRSGNFLVDNCVFENNRHNLKQYPNGSNGGGAIHNWSNKLTIQNSTFTNNHGQNGGSIYTWGNNTEIINCKFTGNKAVDFGGAIFKNNNSAKIENCEFRNNEAQSGGAISNNHRNISISRSIFENNTALVGGAIHHSFGNTTLNQIVFRNNTAKEGGAISKVWDKISVSNSLFEKNTATGIGGAIVAARDEMELANNTFVFNTNTAIAIWDKIVQNGKIYNSIFYGNTANTVYANANADIDRLNPYSDNYNYNGWTLELRRNILQNTPKGGTLAANQINVNPLFVNND
ncbi:MAG: hypothetical protein Q4G08_11485, partial [Capnocytophaga sp.]|nr:hypothetical protein [Capnocytophaga sp.]